MKINFLGIGSAWNIQEDNTSAYIKNGRKMILIDCGESIARKIIYNNTLSNVDELYILISHTHSDHIGSLGTLLFYSKYSKRIVNRIVLTENEAFNYNLKEYLRLVDISDEVEYVDSEFLKKKFDFKTFNILKANHAKSLPCNCFVFEDANDFIYYSADNNNINYIKDFIKISNAKIYTEICDNPNLRGEHLYLSDLEECIDEKDRGKVYLMHINEMMDISELLKKGFKIAELDTKYKKMKRNKK